MSTPELRARVHDWAQSNRQEIFQTLRDFVALDTINHAPDGNEAPAQMAFAQAAEVLGLRTDVYEIAEVPGLLDHPQYWSARPCEKRPNVFATCTGKGDGRSLILSGHMDTVGPGPDAWSHDPFGGQIENGKFFGLGSYDMKGGVIASLMTAKALSDLKVGLHGDLSIESVVDEEQGGCNGTLAARLKYNADFAILTEPTDLDLCVAHLGGLALRVNFHGKPGIGISAPIDPTRPLAHFLLWLQDWNARRAASTRCLPFYPNGDALMIGTSQLQAGNTALNFMGDRVPSLAWVTVFIGTFPGANQAALLHSLKTDFQSEQRHHSTLAAFEPDWEAVRWLDGSEISSDHAGVQTMAGVLAAVRNRPAAIRGAKFQCDGHMFNLYSPTPAVIFGPSGGNAHAPDEFIFIEEYLLFIETLICTAVEWCGLAD